METLRAMAKAYWKLRPFYRLEKTLEKTPEYYRVRWDPLGKTGGRQLNFKQFCLLVKWHQEQRDKKDLKHTRKVVR